jgi:hypothetical protein
MWPFIFCSLSLSLLSRDAPHYCPRLSSLVFFLCHCDYMAVRKHLEKNISERETHMAGIVKK